MDEWQLFIAGVGTILLVVGGAGKYILSRLAKFDERTEADIQNAKKENGDLKARIADLEEKAKRVPELERRLQTLLDEMGDMQKRLGKTEAALDTKSAELERSLEGNRRLQQELADKCKEIEALTIQNEAYKTALSLIGDKLASISTPPAPEVKPEPGEATTSDVKPQEKEQETK